MEFVEMKDRIAHIIRAKNLTAAEFALRLGIQPSNISHLLSGRNNPSLDFVKKLKETFPEYNLDWIVLGKGPMTVSEPFVEPGSSNMPDVTEQTIKDEADLETLHGRTTQSSEIPNGIIMMFEDGTYRILSPR